MIVPTSSSRSVRIAPDAASFWGAAFPDAGDIASSEVSGAAFSRINRLIIRHTPIRQPHGRAWLVLSAKSPDVTIAGVPRSTDGKRRAFELFKAMSRCAMR